MINKFSSHRIIFIFIPILILFVKFQNIMANEIPYLLINCDDSDCYEIKLNNQFCIKNKGDILEISKESENIEISINSITSIGFLFKDEEAGIEINTDNIFTKIEIYDLEGRFIKETSSEFIDFEGLQIGKPYVLKKGKDSYKYIRYK